MSTQVKVEDLEIFNHFRIALLKFGQAVDHSLSNAESHIARTHSWLENEQTRYWEGQIRKRMEAVTRAKDAVRQKKLYLDATGRTRNASEEEKALARCVAQLEEAHTKSQAVRKALPRLEKAADMYRSGVSRLSADIGSEIPRAIARLDRMAASLEQYVAIESPDTQALDSAPASDMSRGGEGETPPPPDLTNQPPGQQPAAPPAATFPPKEGGHVDHGQ